MSHHYRIITSQAYLFPLTQTHIIVPKSHQKQHNMLRIHPPRIGPDESHFNLYRRTLLHYPLVIREDRTSRIFQTLRKDPFEQYPKRLPFFILVHNSPCFSIILFKKEKMEHRIWFSFQSNTVLLMGKK